MAVFAVAVAASARAQQPGVPSEGPPESGAANAPPARHGARSVAARTTVPAPTSATRGRKPTTARPTHGAGRTAKSGAPDTAPIPLTADGDWRPGASSRSAPALASTQPAPPAAPPGDTVPPGVPAPGAPLPSAPAAAPAPPPPTPQYNIPGVPNFAGRLGGALSRGDVIAPLVATVGGGSGAEVMHVQVLLDAARFSPGAVSGVWNENTVFALRAFRYAAGLPPGDSADAAVIARLERVVGARAPLTEYTVTAADRRGPYRPFPSSVYAQAHMDCLCYTSMVEMLAERFHTTSDALRALNPGVDLARAPVGTRLVVPNVVRGPAPKVARLVVDKREGSVRGLDARGATRFWLPATVGSTSLPSPTGRLRVVSATPNPRYRYDPVVLGELGSTKPGALLPAGPNSPVGVLWAQLSRPHVGLHGTPYPEDVGYTMSHGCVRLANWDAHWLTPILQPGLVVDFVK